MTMYVSLPTFGVQTNGQYRITPPTASGSATYAAGGTNVGTGGAHPNPFIDAYGATGPTIEDAGIRAGEIVGYRAWKIMIWGEGPTLHSMVMDYYWTPGANEHEKCVEDYNGKGFYAFKNARQPFYEYNGYRLTQPIAFGKVLLWGKVMEHEDGYRAEYAKVSEITEVFENSFGLFKRLNPRYQSTIDRLRHRYGV